jgi:uncharacterized protein YceK
MLSFVRATRPALLLILISALALAGCESVFTPISPQAQSIANLATILLLF